MEINYLLSLMGEMDASDVYLSAGAPITFRAHGKLITLDVYPGAKGSSSVLPLSKLEIKRLAYSIMDQDKVSIFETTHEMNMAYTLGDSKRFRVNIFVQRGNIAMVIRRIHTIIPSIEDLGLPPILKDIIMEKRGLILFVGSTGCGKSTSLAALINYRNETHAGHIITIEDPIEFVHQHKKSIVNQREVGLDTLSYSAALKNTLRQAPDVILLGEARSRNVMEHAIAFAETGHLCLTTLHANNANQAFDRIINFFPKEKRAQLLLDLSFNIKAIISQRLINNLEGKRSVAVEVLLGTPLVLSLIHRGEFDSIKEIMEKSTNLGMQTFDQSLEILYNQGKISLEEALRNADSRNNLRLKIALHDKPQSSFDLSVASDTDNLKGKPEDDPDKLKLVDD